MKGWVRKGQVTLFVILGIFILALIALAIYMKTTPQQEQLKKEVTEVIPGEFQPVKQYVERCVYEIGKEALVRAGQQGGYVDPVKSGVLSIPEFPTQGSGVELAPSLGVILPYWFYMRSSDKCFENCVFDSKRPPLSRVQGANSVEEQVDKYVEEHLPVCLDKFKAFKDQFDVKEKGPMRVTTTIADEGVSFFMEYPLEVSRNKVMQQISQYQTQLPLNFKELYDLASVLLQAVEDPNIRFFERLSLSAVGAYGLGKNSVIPPMEGGTRFGLGSPEVWQKSKVKGEVQSLLADNVPIVDVLGALNSQIVLMQDNPTFNGIYSNYHITLDTIPPVDLSSKMIEFNYLDWWPLYLDLPQSKGEVIMPDTVMSFFLIPIGFQNFDFTYDYSFPVSVRIRDVDSLKGEGFTFQYAFEVNVRNNRALESVSGVGMGQKGSLFCDVDKRNSGDVKIVTKTVDGKPLGDVTIGFSCADSSCFVGKTDGSGVLVVNLPICMNGLLTPNKEDFFGPAVPFSAALGQGGSAAITLDKVRPLKASLLKLPLTKIPPPDGFKEDKWNDDVKWSLNAQTAPLGAGEKGVVVLERVQGSGEDPFIQFMEFDTPEEQDLKLVPGTYNYQGFIYAEALSNPIKLEKRKICAGGFLGIGEQCSDIEGMEFNDSFMLGRAVLDETTSGSIEVTVGNVDGGKVVFFIPTVNVNDVKYHEDLMVTDYIENLSNSNRAALLPRFG